jgi:hypothetical protein
VVEERGRLAGPRRRRVRQAWRDAGDGNPVLAVPGPSLASAISAPLLVTEESMSPDGGDQTVSETMNTIRPKPR